MKEYWPQDKVFLFGQAALFPKKLIGEIVDTDYLYRLFPHGYSDYLITETAPADPNGNQQFKITNIDAVSRAKFIIELKEYLQKYQQNDLTTGAKVLPTDFTHQEQKLVLFARNSANTNRWRKTITLTDLWTDQKDRDQRATTFWELLLTEHFLEGNIELLNIDYEGTYMDAAGEQVPLPFAEFKILLRNTLFQMATVSAVRIPSKQTVDKPTERATHKATLTLTKRRLKVTIDGKPYALKRYTSKSDSYRAINKLYAYAEAKLTLDRFDLKSAKTSVKDVPKSMGFTGILRELFIEYDNSTKAPTLQLHKAVTIDDPLQYDELLAFANKKKSKDSDI